MELTGKVVAVTGAFGHLGRAVVRQVLREGGKVALLDRVTGDMPEGAGENAMAVQVDLGSQADAARAMEAIAAEFGRIDALVNLAGGFRWQTFEGSDLSEWTSLFAINLMTCVTASKAVLPHLQRAGGGRIVNVGAAAATKAGTGMGAYAASKAGVARFTEALAEEVKLQGITVNAVLPTIIDTPQNRADMPEADFDRWVKPQEIAQVVVFLVSDKASAVTGALLPIAGRT